VSDASLRLSRAEQLLESISAIVYESDVATGTILFANTQIRPFTQGVAPKNMDELTRSVHPDDLRRTLDLFAEAVRYQRPTTLEYRAFKEDRVVHLEQRVTFDVSTGSVRARSVIVDATARKTQERELAERALHDTVTGLANRSLFRDRIDHALHRSRRTDAVHTVMLIDMDDFSTFNHTFGQHRGDAVLSEIGRRIATTLRANDSVARLSGDLFGVLLEETGADTAWLIVRRLLTALAVPFDVEDHQATLSAKVGFVISAPDAESEQLLRFADAALVRGKDSHSEATQYDFEQDATASRRLTDTARVRQAIADNELVLHYQPIVCLKTGAVTGSEALVRWQHPDHGLLPPMDFLHVAAAGGLMGQVARRVVETAVRQMREWFDQGLDLVVNVNLSSHELGDESLMQWILAILDEHRVERSRLVVELTEGELLTDSARAIASLGALRRVGIRSAIDDFGTGYSSLVWLRDLPVDILKIDRSFVGVMVEDQRARAIVSSTMELARSLHLQMVAEGVETEETAVLLRSMGCDRAQGYYFSKPLAAQEFAEFVKKSMPVKVTQN
jgi:diguanylate cyclase (GGDEF)-like protein